MTRRVFHTNPAVLCIVISIFLSSFSAYAASRAPVPNEFLPSSASVVEIQTAASSPAPAPAFGTDGAASSVFPPSENTASGTQSTAESPSSQPSQESAGNNADAPSKDDAETNSLSSGADPPPGPDAPYPTETKTNLSPPPPSSQGSGADDGVYTEDNSSSPPPAKSRLSDVGEDCGGTPPLICRQGLICIPNDSGTKTITVNTPGKCRTGYNSEPCSISSPCKRTDYECLTDKQLPVRKSDDKSLSQGTCAPKLNPLPSGYLGALGEQCGNVTRYPPDECVKCRPVVRYLPCSKGLVCMQDTHLYMSQYTYTDRFNVYVIGTCQYPGTGAHCSRSSGRGGYSASDQDKLTSACKSPLTCVQTYYNWYNVSGQIQTNQCMLPGSGSRCSQSTPCPKPLLCLYVGSEAIQKSSGRGLCGTWGPNAPAVGDVRPIRFDAEPNDRCDIGQPVTCPKGYGCGKDPERYNNTRERDNYYCILASSAAALFSNMRYVLSILGAILIASLFL